MTDPGGRPALVVGERIRLGGDRNLWTVQAVSPNFAAIVRQRPFMPKGEVFYSVIDWRRNRRGPCNLIGQGYGDGSYSRDDCTLMLDEFEAGALEVTSRNWVTLEQIEQAEPGDSAGVLELAFMVRRLDHLYMSITATTIQEGLDILEPRGLVGEDARTSLMSLLIRLTPLSAWKRMPWSQSKTFHHGVSETFMGWEELGRRLSELVEGFSDAERARRVHELFGSDALRPALVFEAVHCGR